MSCQGGSNRLLQGGSTRLIRVFLLHASSIGRSCAPPVRTKLNLLVEMQVPHLVIVDAARVPEPSTHVFVYCILQVRVRILHNVHELIEVNAAVGTDSLQLIPN